MGWVLRSASVERGKFLSAESSMSALTTHGKCVWAPPLNLVPELLMVLGATTSLMCSICHTHIHTALMMRGLMIWRVHIGAMRC